MMSTNRTRTRPNQGSPDDSSDESNIECYSRQLIIDKFGDGGTIDGYEDARYTIGEERVVVWIPEDNETPFGIQLSEYSAATTWTEGNTIIDEENVRVYVLTLQR